jgi:glycerophosphoryl diester phosphodiesterase
LKSLKRPCIFDWIKILNMQSRFTGLVFLILLSSFQISIMAQDYKIFGHRGCRGVLPENTIIGFQKALEAGADGIEWDIVVNKDNQLVISHEPYMDATYCLDSNGQEFNKSEQNNFNIFNMNQKEVESFDCGYKVNPKFPDQKLAHAVKPLLQDAFLQLDLSETTVLFEVKSDEKDYGVFQPQPDAFAKLIFEEVKNFKYKDNLIYMCFDPNLLNELHKLMPDAKYVYLTYKPFKGIENHINDIDFTPYALGMYFRTIRKKGVKKAKELGVKTFAWTVNKTNDYDRMVRYNVAGIITDFPEKYVQLK